MEGNSVWESVAARSSLEEQRRLKNIQICHLFNIRCAKHLARMLSGIWVATLEAGALPSPCGREGN